MAEKHGAWRGIVRGSRRARVVFGQTHARHRQRGVRHRVRHDPRVFQKAQSSGRRRALHFEKGLAGEHRVSGLRHELLHRHGSGRKLRTHHPFDHRDVADRILCFGETVEDPLERGDACRRGLVDLRRLRHRGDRTRHPRQGFRRGDFRFGHIPIQRDRRVHVPRAGAGDGHERYGFRYVGGHRH